MRFMRQTETAGPHQFGNPEEFTMLELAELDSQARRGQIEDRPQAASRGRSEAAHARHLPGASACSNGSPPSPLEDGLKRDDRILSRSASERAVTAERPGICRLPSAGRPVYCLIPLMLSCLLKTVCRQALPEIPREVRVLSF